MRLFVAIEISDPIRETLGRATARLRQCNAPVKWVRSANLHLTLKFLGDVPDDRLSEVRDILCACAEGIRPFPIDVRGIGAFPNLNRPRVIFTDALDATGQAKELASRLNRRMTRAGVPREDRPFRCHTTLGRVRKPGPMQTPASRFAELEQQGFGKMTVREIALIQSQLNPNGPVYTRIDRVELVSDPANTN